MTAWTATRPSPEGGEVNDTRIGKLVRWSDEEHFPGRWFTARVTGDNGWGGHTGEVLDPGNFRGDGGPFAPGDLVPNLRPHLITEVERP